MLIDCLSDLHGHYPILPGGDLLIIAGDLTATDTEAEHEVFISWLRKQHYSKKIFIAGNHDGHCMDYEPFCLQLGEYLCDSGCEFAGLKIWGSPWTLEFCDWHFMRKPHEMADVWAKIPSDTDILITHSPPKGILDATQRANRAGCQVLADKVAKIKPKLHVFGHIHEGYGSLFRNGTHYVNAAHMDKEYRPVNSPIRIELTI